MPDQFADEHEKFTRFLKNTCRWKNGCEKNGVSICDGFLTQYRGPHKIF